MTAFLKLNKLTKDFGNNKGAFEIDLEIREGEIVGFLGPNGAGKTTTMSMVLGFTVPTSGSFDLFGQKEISVNNIQDLMPEIGVMLSEVSFEPGFTSRQTLTRNQSLLKKNLKDKIQELADFLELDLDKKFKDLSTGNKKKAGIINALMHDPKLVIMDEPTSGLDPVMQQRFLDLLEKVKARNGAVFLSSHVLSEVQAICDRIVMIKKGKKILEGNTSQILDQALKVFRVNNLNQEDSQKIQAKGLAEKTETRGQETLLYTQERLPLLRYLMDNQIHDFYLEKPRLEDMFYEEYK
jgi:ABC-2 type transport system ATP-binding protein